MIYNSRHGDCGWLSQDDDNVYKYAYVLINGCEKKRGKRKGLESISQGNRVASFGFHDFMNMSDSRLYNQ